MQTAITVRTKKKLNLGLYDVLQNQDRLKDFGSKAKEMKICLRGSSRQRSCSRGYHYCMYAKSLDK